MHRQSGDDDHALIRFDPPPEVLLASLFDQMHSRLGTLRYILY
jgi:hypothetical protein